MICKQIPFVVLLATLCVFACTKPSEEPTDPTDDKLSITYPAAYVALFGENEIAVINLDSQKVSDRIPLPMGGQPYRMTLSPDESRILVSMQKADNGIFPILVIDATTGKELSSIPLEESTMNAVWSPDGKEVWLALRQSGKVQVFDATRDFELRHEIPTEAGAGQITFTFDGVYVVVSNPTQNTIHFIHSLNKDIFKVVPVGDNAEMAYASALQRVFTSNQGDQSITVVRADNFEVESSISLDFRPGPMIYTLSDFHLWVLDLDGDKVVRYQKSGIDWLAAGAIATGLSPNHFALTNDNELMLISNRQDGTISFIDVLGQNKTTDLSVGGEPCGVLIRE